ncbi:hypothetical protein N9K77_00660 [bacterium]|nr:hypothetical protein [bacterium]
MVFLIEHAEIKEPELQGKGHEVKYGFENGFENIFYMDFSKKDV